MKKPLNQLNIHRLWVNRIIILFSFILGFSSNLYAQSDNIKFGRISIEDGLSQNGIICILQDSKGFMWFGTQDGLNKYDGKNITVYKNDLADPNSLGHNSIYSIIEDSRGNLWVGTGGGGLHRFDQATESFTRYQNDSENPNSLSHNFVYSIFEDHQGMLWVGTNEGVNVFDYSKNKFTRYQNNLNHPNSLSHNNVRYIYEDSQRKIWIGTNNGLNQFDRNAKHFIRYQNNPQDSNSLSHNAVKCIYEDRTGTLWIGTLGGLNRYNRAENRFIRYQHNSQNSKSLSHNEVRSIYETSQGFLWIATNGGGLNRFDRANGEFTHYKNNPADPNSLSDNRVYSVFEDRSGLLWVGTWVGGIHWFNPAKKQFIHYKNDPAKPNSLSDNSVYALYQDHSGALWVGTDDGLNLYDSTTKQFIHYKNDPKNPNSLTSSRIWAIYGDPNKPGNVLWIGTNNGLNRFDRLTNTYTRYQHNSKDPNSISNNRIFCLYTDSRGTLWIGTDGGGLNQFNPSAKRFIHYQSDINDPASLPGNRVGNILEDRLGTLWIGTNGGLSRFDPTTKQFTNYRHDPNNPYSLSDNNIWSFCEDRAGNFWVGSENGLNLFDRETERFTHFTEKDGLPNNWIYSILEDDKGNLWISTNNGLSKFNPETRTFKNYNITHGLQSNEFNHAWFKSKSGKILLGGINGFNIFHPDSIKDNSYIPPTIITDFQLFNKSVPIGDEQDGRVILKKSITETEGIELSYEDYVFSFEFAVPHYISPEKNEYAYMMEGLEKDWNYVGNRHFVTYTLLPPGDYIFRTKGSNEDGVWNEEGASLKITITPPYWQTWWFKIFVSLFIILSLYTWYKIRVHNIEVQKRILETTVEERTAEVVSKNEQLKQKTQQLEDTLKQLKHAQQETLIHNEKMSALGEMMAGLAHEINTPLNRIGKIFFMIKEGLQNTSDKKEVNLNLIAKQAKRGKKALELVSEIIEGMLNFTRRNDKSWFSTDVHELIDNSLLMLKNYYKHYIEIHKEYSAEGNIECIPAKMNQVFMNILKNAMDAIIPTLKQKGVEIEKGTIEIKTQSFNGCVQVCIKDNGIGISEENKQKIFDIFFTTKLSQDQELGVKKGTGLGLAITQRIIEEHNGKIEVETQEGKGTEFIINLPANRANHLKN